MHRALLLLTVVAVTAGITAGPVSAADPQDKLVLVLDSSGSMKEPVAGGGTKIAAAKQALGEVVEALPDDSQVGLRVFGAKVFSAKDPGACKDTQNVVPVGPLDRGALTKAVTGYKPHGETPIGVALRGAAKDLGPADGGKRTIVLLSDGEPTCAPDPCKVAAQLQRSGVDVQVNVVGLDVSGKAREALRCIARAGGGSYYDVDEPDEIASSLVGSSVRALREFTLSGDPVDGGPTLAEATEIDPGQYTSSLDAAGTDDYYSVELPKDGSVAVSVTARPERKDTELTQSVTVELTTPAGAKCTSSFDLRANVLGLRSVLSTGVLYGPGLPDMSVADDCGTSDRLVARVAYDGDGRDIAYEIGVQQVPRIEDRSSLPDPLTRDESKAFDKPVAPQADATVVTGGTGFADAPALEPGTFKDTIRPGEQLVYKVPVEWGQSARVSVSGDNDAVAADVLGVLGVNLNVRAVNSFRKPLPNAFSTETGVRDSGRYTGADPLILTAVIPEVRVRNLESTDQNIRRSTLAGEQFVTVEMARSATASQNEFVAPITLSVAIDGEPNGGPKLDEPDEPKADDAKEASPDDDSSDSRPWTLIALGAAAALLVLVVVSVLVARRRRGSAGL